MRTVRVTQDQVRGAVKDKPKTRDEILKSFGTDNWDGIVGGQVHATIHSMTRYGRLEQVRKQGEPVRYAIPNKKASLAPLPA